MSEEDKDIARTTEKVRAFFATCIMLLSNLVRALVITGIVILAVVFILSSYLYTDYLVNGGWEILWESFKSYTIRPNP